MANSLEAKIVVLGSQGVGKTSLVHRYVKNAFTPPDTQSTIGASFLTKRVADIDSSTIVRLQIWDTAGQERFRSISKLYYRGTFAALPPISLSCNDCTLVVLLPCSSLRPASPYRVIGVRSASSQTTLLPKARVARVSETKHEEPPKKLY
jgi:signal recognition particle receptor subunit beta